MLKSRIPQIVVALDVIVEEAVEEGARQVAQAARARVPVDTGRLRDKIHVDTEPEGSYVVAGDQDEVFYGHMVEHGTTHSPPRPFLVPALEESRGQVIGRVRAALEGL